MPREVGLDDGFVVHAPDLLAGVTPDQLAQAYLRATAERPVPRVDLSHVTVDTVTVSETVADSDRRPAREGSDHRSASSPGHLHLRIEVIVRFLALLELCKQGRVTLGQGHDLRRPGGGVDRPRPGELAGVAARGATSTTADGR